MADTLSGREPPRWRCHCRQQEQQQIWMCSVCSICCLLALITVNALNVSGLIMSPAHSVTVHPIPVTAKMSRIDIAFRHRDLTIKSGRHPQCVLEQTQLQRRSIKLFANTGDDGKAPPPNDDGDNDELSPTLKRKLNKEFLNIGVPALIQLAAEPLAALVDTAYLGRLGPEVLGGAGVAISAQYAVSKLYNDPLLRTSISLVASQDGQSRSGSATDDDDDRNKRKLSIAVSSALLLAASVGIVQLVVYTVLASVITKGMGLQMTSPMWHSAVSYLRVRAFGTPAATLWLVSNGIFRGLGDTRTPLVYSFLFTGLNAILDPLFIFTFGFGASGAAAGTALAQYAALVPLLLALNRKVPIRIFEQLKELKTSLKSYLKAGSLVLFRTLGKVLAYSVCARQAAVMGPVAAAAYNLTFQLGFATTQICEAVAVAVQTLLAREMADNTTYSPATKAKVVRHLISTSLVLGGTVASLLSLTTFLQRDSVLAGLTTNVAVRQASAAIFPAVLVTQVFKGLAYPVNGIIMGACDWVFTMTAMWAANLVCVGMIRWWGSPSLGQIWWALAAFMATQVATGILRYESKTGVWKVLKATTEDS